MPNLLVFASKKIGQKDPPTKAIKKLGQPKISAQLALEKDQDLTLHQWKDAWKMDMFR